MAINIALEARREVDPATQPIARNFVGFDPQASDEILWDANRGAYDLDERANEETFATFSVDGTIRVVAELEGVETVEVDGHEAQALLGRILPAGDRIRDELFGRTVEGDDLVSYFDTAELDQMSAAERWGEGRGRRTFLVTYDPSKWVWAPEDEADIITRTHAGAPWRDPWSVGGRRVGIHPGDRIFLLQNSGGVQGVRASGVVSSSIYQAEHWDDPRRMANYIDIDWDMLLAAEDLLALDVLRREIPGYAWTPRKGGVELHEPMASELEHLWSNHLGDDEPSVRRREPGWEMDDNRRRLVDSEARRRMVSYFEERGWEVVETHESRPYAAVATKDDQVVHLIAKGVETANRPVYFDADEAEHILSNEGTCVLGVLGDVDFDSGSLVSGSGSLVVQPAVLKAEELRPVVLQWTPPALD